MRRIGADRHVAGSRMRGAAVATCCAVLAAVAGALTGGGVADAAATASVSISPPSTTVPSGTAVTYTLSVTCSVTGGCNGTTVTFPTTTITGDGSTTDFGSWFGVSSCAGVTKTVAAGVVTYTYGNIPTGTSQCTFTVTPPNVTTANGTQATITPTINGTNFTSSTGGSATLNVTAGHTDSFTKVTSTSVTTSGGPVSYALEFLCAPTAGSTALSALTMTDPFPANFTYISYVSDPGSLPGTVTYDAATNTFTYSDPTGKTCLSGLGPSDQITIDINGTASTDGVPDAPGTTISNTATADWTYVDGTPATSSSTVHTNVVNLIPTPFLAKNGSTSAFDRGTYTFPPDGKTYPYTYPGDWDGSGSSAAFGLQVSTNSTSAGVDFALDDPLPCLNNLSGQVYSSPAPGGPYCTSPAFIPTLVTATGFTPATSDAITVVYTDGTTASIAYTSGKGWVIPASPAVAEIDFPPFPQEGSNSSTTMSFTVRGYAASAATVTSLLTNTVTANAYLVGSNTPLAPQETSPGSLMVMSPAEPSGTVVYPVMTATYKGAGTCAETVGLPGAHPYYGIEIASAPSQAIYIDYLAPAGATVPSGQTTTFTLAGQGQNGLPGSTQSYTTPAIDATVTPDYNGTGRTLLQWVIPAGTITQPGQYGINGISLTVNLGAGCAGTYQNDMTIGYGAPITGCVVSGGNAKPPTNPSADSDLKSNGTPLTGNYCGGSAPITVAAINPAFSVDKSVQGNLDASPAGGGGVGNVSPDGGTASYDVTFTNTGQSNLTDPVMYDILPAAGDTYSTSLGARGSQFGVSLTGVGPEPPGVTVSYSTAANPCRPEVLPSDPGCVNDWTTTAPSPLSSVTALKLAYTGTVYVSGGAGASTFSVPFTVTTPSGIAGEVAWNTIGTTATAGTAAMTPAESSRTGLQAAPSVLGLVKSAAPAQVHAPGDVISYSFAVTNNATVPLTSVAVTDVQAAPAGALNGPVSCPGTTLAPGASMTCTAAYTVTQADVDHGSVDDSATASGTPPSGGAVTSPPSAASVTAAQAPAITIVKSAPSATVRAAGDVIGYQFLVTNAGNVALTSVAVTDAQAAPAGALNGPVSCPDTTLAPGASMTCTAAYTVTQADVDHGSVNDTATASGTPPSGPAVTSPPSTVSVPAPAGPAVNIVKSATPATVHAAGDVISYQFTVTDTGNDTLTGVAVTDVQAPPAGPLDGPVSCPGTTLAPGASVTCTATYTVTQADVDHGSVNDTATASGTPPSGPPVTSPSAGVLVTAAQAPAITVVKSATPAQVHAAGDVISYQFLVTNTGNDTLTSVAVTDTQAAPARTLDGPVTCPDTTLAPGASVTCTATYTDTQADIDNGSVDDSATASGTPPSGPAVTSAASTASVPAAQAPAITVVKSAPATTVTHAGQHVRYSFLVTDTGNVTLRHVVVTDVVAAPSDPASLSPVTCPHATLAPGASETCTATYTVTQADIDHGGPVRDSATATGTPPATAGNPSPAPLPPSPPSAALVRVAQAPAIRMVKTASPARAYAAGDVIRYRFTVTNTGNVTLARVTVSDPRLAAAGITVRCPSSRLAPGRQETCTSSRPYVVTTADAARGTVANTATASAAVPSGQVLRSRPASASVRVTLRAIVIPTGEGASAPVPGASPPLAAAGAAVLAVGTVLLMMAGRRPRRRST